MSKPNNVIRKPVGVRSNVARRPRRPAPKQLKPVKPQRGMISRVFRLFVNGYTISIVLLAGLCAFLTATYFWFDYSEKINGLLSGEIFTQTAGIYSAPKVIRKGEKFSKSEMIAYLKSAGYIPKERQAANDRSRFSDEGKTLIVEPGSTSVVDGKQDFRNLKVVFTPKGDTIQSITDGKGGEEIKQTSLEPLLLNSLAAEGGGSRKAVKYTDIPSNLVKAITVTEDRAFFQHYGVNLRGIARAFWRRYDKGETDSPLDNQGGSSITQQLVKNLLLSPEITLERKAKEAYMSVILETRLSKEEIFTLYANQIYLGQRNGLSIYGVGEAANVYFGKDVSALDLSECAFLAGIIRSPNRYNPYKNPDRVKERRNQVLTSMAEAKAIPSDLAAQAKNTPLNLNETQTRTDQQGMEYFSQFTVEEVPKLVTDPESIQHSRIYTTIDPDLQKIANEIVTRRIASLEKHYKKDKRGNLNGALVAIRPETGEIVAMIGGKNFKENQFNRATNAQRQPGSVFKPFVYTAAINSAYEIGTRVVTAATVFKDEKRTFNFNNDTYSPNNYGDTFSDKEITVRDALVKSKNTITVDLALELNIGRVMNLAAKAGLPKVERAYPSMALGTSEVTPLQMASAYTMFANLGERASPVAVRRITDGNGNTILTPKTEKRRVVKEDVAYIMNDMMKDVINRGTAAEAKAWGFTNVEGKRGYAGKTGTSRDGWFAGFTPHLVCAVYVGFDDGSDLDMKGADSAMPIWAEFMRAALKENPDWEGDWQMPPTIRMAEIDSQNGNLIRELTAQEASSLRMQRVVSKDEQKLAIEPAVVLTVDDAYKSNVPKEFRRIELFVSGTVPTQLAAPADEDQEIISPVKPDTPSTTPTPFTTWQDAQDGNNGGKPSPIKSVTLMVCPVLGMRAGPNCPNPRTKAFQKGLEPERICTFHNN